MHKILPLIYLQTLSVVLCLASALLSRWRRSQKHLSQEKPLRMISRKADQAELRKISVMIN